MEIEIQTKADFSYYLFVSVVNLKVLSTVVITS